MVVVSSYSSERMSKHLLSVLMSSASALSTLSETIERVPSFRVAQTVKFIQGTVDNSR